MSLANMKNEQSVFSYHSISRHQITLNNKVELQKEADLNSNRFYHMRVERINRNFIRKLKQNLQTLQPQLLQSPFTKQSTQQLKLIKAINYPVKVQHFLMILNLAVNLILSILSSFQGFLLDYRQETNSQASSIFMYFCFISYCIIFFVNCTNKNCSDFKNITLITQSIYHYFFFQTMILDLLVIVYCLINILGPADIYIYSIIYFFILIVSLYKNVRKIIKLETIYIKNEVQMLIWSLIKFSITNIIVAHIIGSLMLGMTLLNSQNNWMIKKQIAQQNWDIQYFQAFYWATTTMMTIGYGDITPVNITQTIIISFIEMFSCVVLAFYISAIGGVISRLREKEEDIIRKRIVFDRITKDEKGNQVISADLKEHITEYLQQQEEFENCRQQKLKNDFIKELPTHLRQKYQSERNIRLFKSVSFFNLLNNASISKLSTGFCSKLYYKEEKLLQENKENIMILQKGQIGLTYRNKKSKLYGHILDVYISDNISTSKLLTPEFFSIYNKTNYGLKSKKSSIVWSIDYNLFLDCIKSNSYDFQFYFSNYHKHRIDENQWNELLCERCSLENGRVYHSVFDCSRITYIPLKQKILYKYIQQKYSLNCNRRKYNRTKRVKENTLIKMKGKKGQQMQLKLDSGHLRSNTQTQKRQESANFDKRRLNKNYYIQNSKGQTKGLQEQIQGDFHFFWPIEVDTAQNYKNYFNRHNSDKIGKSLIKTME